MPPKTANPPCRGSGSGNQEPDGTSSNDNALVGRARRPVGGGTVPPNTANPPCSGSGSVKQELSDDDDDGGGACSTVMNASGDTCATTAVGTTADGGAGDTPNCDVGKAAGTTAGGTAGVAG